MGLTAMTTRFAPLFRFSPVETPVHRIPTILKLLGLVASSILIFSGNPLVPAGTGIALAILALVSRIPLSAHLKNIRILFFYTAFILIFRFLGPIPTHEALLAGLMDSARYLGRLSLVLLAGTVFYETTSGLAIRNALYDIQHTLGRFFSRILRALRISRKPEFPDVALLLSLTISFIPRIFETWTVLNLAWDARGGKLHRGLPGAWKRFTVLVPLLLVSLLAVAAETDRAIRNRST